MSKLSSVLPGEAPTSPIMAAGSNCDCEFMRDGDADLGGSTVYLEASLSLSRILCLLFFVSLWGSCHWVLSDGHSSCWGWLSGAFRFALPQQRLAETQKCGRWGKHQNQTVSQSMKQELDKGNGYLFEKRSLPRRTRRVTRRRGEGEDEEEEGGGAERNRSLMDPSPRPDWGLFMGICQGRTIEGDSS